MGQFDKGWRWLLIFIANKKSVVRENMNAILLIENYYNLKEAPDGSC